MKRIYSTAGVIEGNNTNNNSNNLRRYNTTLGLANDHERFEKGEPTPNTPDSILISCTSSPNILSKKTVRFEDSSKIYVFFQVVSCASNTTTTKNNNNHKGTTRNSVRIKLNIFQYETEYNLARKKDVEENIIELLNEPYDRDKYLKLCSYLEHDGYAITHCSNQLQKLRTIMEQLESMIDLEMDCVILENLPNLIFKSSPIVIPWFPQPERQHILLDLDKTLIDSFEAPKEVCQFIIRKRRENVKDENIIKLLPISSFSINRKYYPPIPDHISLYDGAFVRFVYMRPQALEFLSYCFKRFATVSIYTASCKSWAFEIIQHIFKTDVNRFYKCFARNNCDLIRGGFYKPIHKIIEKNPIFTRQNIVLLDDSVEICNRNGSNCININQYNADKVAHASDSCRYLQERESLAVDNTLREMAQYFESIRGVKDLSTIDKDAWLKRRFSLNIDRKPSLSKLGYNESNSDSLFTSNNGITKTKSVDNIAKLQKTNNVETITTTNNGARPVLKSSQSARKFNCIIA
ncbi:hypothetical protein ABK040_009076 [Willaertia magna]